MDSLQTIINAIVVGAVGLTLGWMVHGLRTEVRADISELRREVGELRSDLTQVALAVGARPRAGRG
ncbi:hypothetical protein BH20ACT24_BH20ACT24_18880 [soil metagenome]